MTPIKLPFLGGGSFSVMFSGVEIKKKTVMFPMSQAYRWHEACEKLCKSLAPLAEQVF